MGAFDEYQPPNKTDCHCSQTHPYNGVKGIFAAEQAAYQANDNAAKESGKVNNHMVF